MNEDTPAKATPTPAPADADDALIPEIHEREAVLRQLLVGLQRCRKPLSWEACRFTIPGGSAEAYTVQLGPGTAAVDYLATRATLTLIYEGVVVDQLVVTLGSKEQDWLYWVIRELWTRARSSVHKASPLAQSMLAELDRIRRETP